MVAAAIAQASGIAQPSGVAQPGDSIPRFDRYCEAPITAVRPRGWLLEFLQRQRSGLTGHPEVLSYPYNSCLWAGEITRIGETHGDNWWRYEQTAYYSDGLLRLGYLLEDSALIDKGEAGIRYTLGHAQPNGRLGPASIGSQWPVAVYFRVLEAEYLATGDRRIVEALRRHYLSYTPQEIGQAKRAIVNIEGALWTYGQTGDRRLLELAEKAYAIGGFELNRPACLSKAVPVCHGVTYMEMAKLPAILYTYTGKKIYLAAALNAMGKLDRYHLLPDGVPSSNEFLAGKDPLNSHETCDISDYTWSAGYLLMATGDAAWADHIEKAIFNAGPGAVSKDFKNLQYFSSVNQAIATGCSNQNSFKHGSTWMAYRPCHETECCAGNVHRFMPNYVARMWMRNRNGGPVAALYGPSVETVSLQGGRATGSITETTDYPFSDSIVFTFDLPAPAFLPFTFRIPGWCRSATATIDGHRYTGRLTPGTFVTLTRPFRKGDRIVLHLPMLVSLVSWGKWGVAVERGPLLYAYAIPEDMRVDTVMYANMNGKHSPDPAFPALDIRPAGPWNDALAVDARHFHREVRVVQRKSDGYPLDPGHSPILIRVPARKVKDWTLLEDRYTPPLPAPGHYRCESELDTLTLVPYGSTRLRISVFPRAASPGFSPGSRFSPAGLHPVSSKNGL